MGIEDYHASSADWRAQIRKNERQTLKAIATFVLIYMVVGMVVDVTLVHMSHPQVSLDLVVKALLTFKLIPFASIVMFGIAVLSLMITYTFYDKIMLLGTEYHEITPDTAKNLQEKQLYNVVEEMKVAAGLQFMPRVFIIEADYMNAFASGFSERSAMVAITRGLMEKLDRSEMQAVMAHELSHIRHGDIKVTLTVAVLSNIILIVLDLLFYSTVFGNRNDREDNRLFLVIMILRYVLPILTVLLALFLSRTREYMADAGCVELMRDNEPMARALLKIADDHAQHAEQYEQEYGETAHEQVRNAAYLFDPSDIDPVKSLQNAFSTHPSVEQRLKAIGYTRK